MPHRRKSYWRHGRRRSLPWDPNSTRRCRIPRQASTKILHGRRIIHWWRRIAQRIQGTMLRREIGRAACRGRGENSGGAGSLKKKKKERRPRRDGGKKKKKVDRAWNETMEETSSGALM